MNELIFLFHSCAIMIFVVAALKLGKEALVTCVTVQWLVANLFVTQQITLLGFTTTSSDAFAIGGTIGLNVLHEYYGEKIAYKTVWIGFFNVLFFGIMSYFHLAYIPSEFDVKRPVFEALLSSTPRIVAASLIAYLVSQLSNNMLFAFLRRLFQSSYVTLRSAFTLIVTQFIDTVLFSIIGLAGVVHSLMHVIAVSLVIKLVVILFSTPFLHLISRFFHPADSIEHHEQ